MSSANYPARAGDKTSITSIVNIYDNIQKLAAHRLGIACSKLEHYNYRDNHQLINFIGTFFKVTFESFEELSSVMRGTDPISKYRNSETGGHLLFRPIGWDIYTDIVISGLVGSKKNIEQIIGNISKNDFNLSGPLLANRVWSIKSKKILNVSAKSFKAIKGELISQMVNEWE